MIRREHIPIIVIVAIVLALSFAVWALKTLGGGPQGDIMQAAFDNDIQMLEACVNAGGDVNSLTPEGWTAVMYAASGNNPEAVTFLIRSGADINIRNDDGKTALTLAKEKEFDNVVRILESEGAIE